MHKKYEAYKRNRMRPGMLASLGRVMETPLLKCLVSCTPFLHPSMSRCLYEDMTIGSLLMPSASRSGYVLVSRSGYVLPPGPERVWRNGIVDCSHPAVLCSACCLPNILLGQLHEKVLHKGGFRSVFVGLTLAWVLRYILLSLSSASDDAIASWFTFSVSISVKLLTLVVVVRIRREVRLRYQIPASCGGPCADFCITWWCLPCVIAQIWTHVHDPARTQAPVCNSYLFPGDSEKENRRNTAIWYSDPVENSANRETGAVSVQPAAVGPNAV